MNVRKFLRRWFWTGLIALGVVVLLCNRWVINGSKDHIYTSWALLPVNDIGVVLGTSPYTRDGKPNPQFYGRIQAAVQLYQIGKVKHLIVSGANPDSTYNEPRQMWRELTEAGVPASAITMDFAGLRTLDSMARAAEVFGLSRCTVITQEYHASRAVFIGKRYGMKVVGYAASGADSGLSLRPNLREVFARVKAVLDLYVLRTRPKFLGAPEPIDLNPPDESPKPLPEPAREPSPDQPGPSPFDPSL